MCEFEGSDWETVAADPDPSTDLGYEHELLTAIHVDEDTEQYIFLPGEDDHLTDEEFIIAPTELVRDCSNCR